MRLLSCPPMRLPGRTLLATALLAAALLALPAALASSPPRCFGAASRDPVHPCHNPALRYKVIPTPDNAVLYPNAPCDPVYQSVPYQCTFGLDEDKASGTIALLGDSHATHWRGAIIKGAEAHTWHRVSMTRPGRTFSS